MKSIISILEKHGGKILTLLILTRLGYMLSGFFGLFSSSGGDGINDDVLDDMRNEYGENVMTAEGMKSIERVRADIEQIVANGFRLNTGFTGFFDGWTEDEELVVSILNRYEPHNYLMLEESYFLRTQKTRFDKILKDGRDLRLDCKKYLSEDEYDKVSYLWLGG